MRNTFWVVVALSSILLCLWLSTLLLFTVPIELITGDILVSIISFFISISALIKFIKNWKLWEPAYMKLIGIICSALGIICGGYGIIMLFYIITDPSSLG